MELLWRERWKERGKEGEGGRDRVKKGRMERGNKGGTDKGGLRLLLQLCKV